LRCGDAGRGVAGLGHEPLDDLAGGDNVPDQIDPSPATGPDWTAADALSYRYGNMRRFR
jgi:hypothetical protein